MKRRVLALILALILIPTLVPGQVSAAQVMSLPEPAFEPLALGTRPQPQAKTYSVTMTCSGSGKAELYNTAAGAGESIYFLADPDPGYRLSDNCGYYRPEEGAVSSDVALYYIGANLYELVMPAGDVVLELEFVKITTASHNVKLNVAAGGMASVDQMTAKKGESLFVEVITSPDYYNPTVKAYSGGREVRTYYLSTVSGVRLYELFMPEGDLEIQVNFKKIYNSVTVTVENGLGGTAVADVAEAKQDKLVTLTCIPDAGYRVARITGVDNLTDNGNGTYTFTMPDKAVDIRVLFVRMENPFLDVNETQFFYLPVLWAVENGITSGISAEAFGPFQDCNRAQVVTFLWRAAGSPEPTTENPFTDVQAGSWYEKPVLWAVENGITNGLTAATFGPTSVCNRAQVVTFLHRAQGSPVPALEENPFADVQSGSWYEQPVLWALENGITTGTTATTFNPTGRCQRAQVVTFLHRADQISAPLPEEG